MRLTLRTLLAWLDDTLTPNEVRAIGKQVAESLFAKELVERIQKVTRQRRLTVPPRSGPDAVDANVVAAYLDNELEPEAVGDFEKRCLTSDVHLAEVASAHQILSLIGQKAKVPAEARQRMYQVVRGRESQPRKPAPHVPPTHPPTPAPPERVSQPVQEWARPAPPRRPWTEQFGPIAAVAALMAVLCWSAWQSLRPAAAPSGGAAVVAVPLPANPAPPAAAPVEAAPKPEPAAPAVAVASADVPIAKGEETGAMKAEPATAPAAGKAAAAVPRPAAAPRAGADIPAGAAGLALKGDGLFLKYDADKREWERLTAAAPVRDGERLLALAPFRAAAEFGGARIDLVGPCDIQAAANPPGSAAKVALNLGRLVLHAADPALPVQVALGDKLVTVTARPGQAVGIERTYVWAPGEAVAGPPLARFVAAEGPVSLAVQGGSATTLEEAGAVTLDAAGEWVEKASAPAPDWVTATAPTPFEQKAGEPFLALFRPDRPVVPSLVEATEDPEPEVCRLGIEGLRAVGDVSYVVPLLNKRNGPTAVTARRTAIGVLRAALAQGDGPAKLVRDQLNDALGADVARATETLLNGYDARTAADPATVSKLVQVLGTTGEEDLGLRELALDNLMRITQRDDLGYDPEKPTGKGLKAWKDLAQERDAKAPPPPDRPRAR